MNLLRALSTIGGMTLLSRILGFVRDFVIARMLGAGSVTDAFFVAFRIPNLLRRLFAEGAFSQAFVPILAEYKNKRLPEETHQLVSRVATLLGLVVAVVAVVGMIFTPFIIWASAPGFIQNPAKFELTVTLTRITFPYIFFMALVALGGGILNTWSRFTIPAVTPVLLNLSFIVMALWASPYFSQPVMALGWAVILGGVLQLALQLKPLANIGMLPRWDLYWRDPGVNRILKLMAPAILGVSVSQISLLINTVFASFLPNGSVSWLYYADRLMEFPSGMLGVALGTVLLPSLSKLHSQKAEAHFSSMLDWGIRLCLLLTLPAALSLALLGIPLIVTLFYYGAFSAESVMQTRLALAAYSVGLVGIIMVKILAPAFYARQDVKTPVRFGILTLIATQLMNLVFIFWLHLNHAGLALSIGLGACLNASLLLWKLKHRQIYLPSSGWLPFLGKLVLALLVLGSALWWGVGAEHAWFDKSKGERIIHLFALVFGGAVLYCATLFALGFRLKDFKRHAA